MTRTGGYRNLARNDRRFQDEARAEGEKRVMAASITLNGVSKTYQLGRGQSVQALTSTDLQLRPGEFFSLVGPSGCGKTTILNMVAGLLPATEGEVRIGDTIIEGPDPRVSVVFQKPVLLRWLSVMDNVLLPSKVKTRITPELVRSAQQLLEMTGLGEFAHRYPTELSGGMQQRASIVRALASEPMVLLMDEPFSALDEFTRENLNDEILRLWSQRSQTVVFVTHNIAEAIYLSDRVGVMQPRPGRLRAIVDIDLERPRKPSLRSTKRFFELATQVRTMFDEFVASASSPNGSHARGETA
ncbi:MAG: ABC transporter ATP-binding protein [Lautropia sp.]